MCCPREQTLSQMVRDFIESESPTIFRSSSDSLQVHHESASLSLQEILENVTDAEIEVLGKVLLYLDDTEPMDQKPDNLRKWVGLNLKIDSYEASLCKTFWVTTFGRPAGDYEYIDVMIHGDIGDEPTRLIIDIDFRSQFELARPTPTYTELSNSLPPIFVGTEEKLNKLISLLCSAAEQSLKERELHIPPWRKVSYMQSKWLSQNCKKASF